MNEISKLLSSVGYIPVNKDLIKNVGLHEAILIGELCAEYNQWDEMGLLEEGAFYSTRESIEENTGLNEHYQRKAMQTLQDCGILTVQRKGVPAKNYYTLNFDKILTSLTSRCSRDEHQDVHDVNLSNNSNIAEKHIASKRLGTNNSNELFVSEKPEEFVFGKRPVSEKKENLYDKCIHHIDAFTDVPELRNKLIEFLRYRLSIKDKPLYENQWKGILRNLGRVKEQCPACTYEEIIDQSIIRGYLNFYPVQGKRANVFSEPDTRSEKYTEDELSELRKLSEEREKNGERAYF